MNSNAPHLQQLAYSLYLSSDGTLRDELLNQEVFYSRKETQNIIENF